MFRCCLMAAALVAAPVFAQAQSVFRLADAFAGSGSSNITRLTGGTGRAFFVATSAATGTEVWATDGSAAGTRIALDLVPGAGSPVVEHLVACGDRALVVASIQNRTQVWFTDGTAAGSIRWEPDASSINVYDAVSSSARCVFSAVVSQEGGVRSGTWVTDGTLVGTYRASATTPSLYRALELPGAVLFADYDTLYSSAGAEDDAAPILENCGGALDNLCFMGGAAYFSCGASLYRSNGSLAGTEAIFGLPGSSSLYSLTCARTFVLASLYASPNLVLYKFSESTPSGATVSAGNGAPWFGGGGAAAPVGDRVVFTADTNPWGTELWSTDGTNAGTVMLADLWPGPTSSNPYNLAGAGSFALFTAYTPAINDEVWLTNGTPSGTSRVSFTLATFAAESPVTFGKYILFEGNEQATGSEPWVLGPCGDGVRDPGETCERGESCCTNNCALAAPGTRCAQDGVFCNGAEECDAVGNCVSPGDQCPNTVCAHCNEDAGACADPVTTPCGDPMPNGICDGPDHCDGRGACGPGHLGNETICNPSAGECDEDDRCTGDSPTCSTNVVKPNGSPCGDGLSCTGEEVCRAGQCMAGTPVVCTSTSVCATAMCVEDAGCVQVPIPDCCGTDNDCNDNNPCTTDDCTFERQCVRTPIEGCTVMPDGGVVGSSSSSGSSGGGSTSSGGSPPPSDSGGGCACDTSSTTGGPLGVLLGALFLALRRRAR